MLGSSAQCHSTGPADSTWLPSGRPSTSCAAREASISAPRSMPGLDPHLVQHRDEILGGDVAGGAGRHRDSRRARRTTTRSCRRRPRARPARWPGPGRGCCGSGRSARRRAARSRAAAKNSRTCTRVGHPGGVAEADLGGAASASARGDREHALAGHVPLVGAPERHRDHALAAQPFGRRTRERALEARPATPRPTVRRSCGCGSPTRTGSR